MKKIKEQKGSITLFVLVACLFFITFLTSMFILSAVKRQAQIEATKQTGNTYEQGDKQEIYESYFGDDTVPIYTKEQLEKMCSGEQISIKEEGGKIYTFSSNAVYVLKNDISFEYNGVWQIPTYFGETGRIEGMGKKIAIKDTSKVEEVYYYYTAQNNYTQSITKEGYQYAGLLLQYDGIRNTKDGHNSTTTIWEDLSGNGKDGNLVGVNYEKSSGWGNNCLILDGTDDGISLQNSLVDLFKEGNTIEIVVEFYENGARDVIIGNYNQTRSD